MIYAKYLLGYYKESKYNTIVKCNEGHLLHNQMTGGLILLDDEKYQQWLNITKFHKLVDAQFLQYLIDEKFLINHDHDELEVIANLWEKGINNSANKSLTIVTTDRCNLGCTYCYEEKSEWRNMDTETQERLKVFLRTYIESSPTTNFKVTWFGGEPTLNLQCIENLTAYIDELCGRLNIPWSSYMVTNGTTLTESVIARLQKCKVNRMQVTVDGMKEYHDQLRPYLSDLRIEEMNQFQIAQRQKIEPNFGLLPILDQPQPKRSSFDEIVKNLDACYKAGMKVDLRVNVGESNKDCVGAFFKFIEDKGWPRANAVGGRIAAYAHTIFEGCGDCPTASREEESKKEIEYSRISGQSLGSLAFTGGTCTANKNHQFVINSSGAIVKCWHHATNDKHAISNIDNLDIARNGSEEYDKYKFNPLEDEECRTCSVLPLCLGGCKQSNNFDKEGYAGKKYHGCLSVRWSLPERILETYQRIEKK